MSRAALLIRCCEDAVKLVAKEPCTKAWQRHANRFRAREMGTPGCTKAYLLAVKGSQAWKFSRASSSDGGLLATARPSARLSSLARLIPTVLASAVRFCSQYHLSSGKADEKVAEFGHH